jgi:hypothetical protein
MDGVSHHERRSMLLLPVFCTFAYLAALCLVLMRKLAETFTRHENIPLVLKDSDTIVAVGKTTKGMMFYVRNNQA